jgi:hypothetical protein
MIEFIHHLEYGCRDLKGLSHTRALIHAFRKASRHVLAMEEDASIFKDILQSLVVDLVNDVLKKQQLDDIHLVEESNNKEQLQILDIIPQFRFYM